MKKIIITGATSFIGCAIVKNLLNKGNLIYAVTRIGSNNIKNIPKHKNLHLVYADLSELRKIGESVPKCDAFFHFGWEGIGSRGRADVDIQGKNVKYALEAMLLAKSLGCTCFIQAGSQAEYGNYNDTIYETGECRPVSEYGKAKLEVYKLGKVKCKELGLKYMHLRIFSVYGPDDHEWTLISQLINKLSNNEDVNLSMCKQYWNYMYIDDAAEAIVRLYNTINKIQDYACEIYNIASNDTRVLSEFVEEVKKYINTQGKLLYGKNIALTVTSIKPNISKLTNLIKWCPEICFKEGIKRCLIYTQENDESR